MVSPRLIVLRCTAVHYVVYPAVLGLAGSRFPAHSGTVFGVLFTMALTGGMTRPWVTGRAAAV